VRRLTPLLFHANDKIWGRKDEQKRRQAAALLCECQGPALEHFLFLFFDRSPTRETDCYTWHDIKVVTLSRMRPAGAIPLALGSLSPEAMRSQELGLATLCGVESFPGAGGLLYGQRSYRTIFPNDIRALLF